MDLSIRLEKVDAQGRQIIRETYPGGAAPTQITDYLRVSRRALDPRHSIEAEPFLLLQGDQRLSPGEIVPVDISIWPMAMKFHPGEQLKLTISQFRNDPMHLLFGLAAIDVPRDTFTFEPGDAPGGMTAEVRNLTFLLDTCKQHLGDNFTWSALGIGRGHLPIVLVALALGGNIRVGMEDNILHRKGELAQSNTWFVESVKQRAAEVDKTIATPDDTRAILGLTRQKPVSV